MCRWRRGPHRDGAAGNRGEIAQQDAGRTPQRVDVGDFPFVEEIQNDRAQRQTVPTSNADVVLYVDVRLRNVRSASKVVAIEGEDWSALEAHFGRGRNAAVKVLTQSD